MEEERLQCSLPRVQVSRQLAPTPTDDLEEPEQLGYEELEERLAPGGAVKRTAGWGC